MGLTDKLYGYGIRKTKRNSSTFPDRQVIHHPKQITSVEQLKVGAKYVDVVLSNKGKMTVIEIDSLAPELLLEGRFSIKCNNPKMTEDSWKRLRYNLKYLSDRGLVPYVKEEGRQTWNDSSYLVPLEVFETDPAFKEMRSRK